MTVMQFSGKDSSIHWGKILQRAEKAALCLSSNRLTGFQHRLHIRITVLQVPIIDYHFKEKDMVIYVNSFPLLVLTEKISQY